MKNEELWNQYKEYTQELTVNCRKLGFASAGICWLFKTETYTFSTSIIYALGFTVAFFMLDILQYISAALIIRFWTRSKEKKMWEQEKTLEGEYNKPAWLDYPTFTMWWLKIISLFFAFGSITIHLIRT